jgi:hypothetical protein
VAAVAAFQFRLCRKPAQQRRGDDQVFGDQLSTALLAASESDIGAQLDKLD